MAAANTDKARKSYSFLQKTLSSGISDVATTLTPNNVTNIPTDTGVTMIIDRVDSAGNATPTLREIVTGTISGGTIANLLRGQHGTTAQSHASGAVVEFVMAGNMWNDLIDLILAEHNQSGGHTNISLTGHIDVNDSSTAIRDSSDNELVKFDKTTSAVNEITIKNAATGNAPRIYPSGGDTNVDLNLRGKGTGAVKHGAGAVSPFPFDYVASGCVWSGDAYGSTRAASMTSGVIVIGGNPLTAAAVSARSFTASKDTYIDASDNGDGTALLTYTEVTNNAASPALAAGSVRIGIIVTGASNIANAGSVNQGEETKVLPIASSIAYSVTDSLGNLICPRDPSRKLLGYRQITGNLSSLNSTSAAQLTGLSVPVIVPTGRKVKVSVETYGVQPGAALYFELEIWNGVVGSGSQVNAQQPHLVTSATVLPIKAEAVTTPSGSVTFNAGYKVTTSSATILAGATYPAFIKVELL